MRRVIARGAIRRETRICVEEGRRLPERSEAKSWVFIALVYHVDMLKIE